MDGTSLAGKINRGLAVAAGRIGECSEIYRPTGSRDPVCLDHRVASMLVRLYPGDQAIAKAARFGSTVWTGLFDRGFVQVGDYIVSRSGTFFVAALDILAPAVCILANRTVTISRTPEPAGPGENNYGGVRRSAAIEKFNNWPVSLIMMSENRPNRIGLPGAGAAATTMMLMPKLPDGVAGPWPSDLVSDDFGFSYVVGAVEQTSMGWRAALKLTIG